MTTFYSFRNALWYCVPASLHRETLLKLHQAANDADESTVWCPGISQQIKELIEQCLACVKNYTREPLMPTPLPDFPWQKVAMEPVYYLIIVVYFQVAQTLDNPLVAVVDAVFSRHGISELSKVTMARSFPPRSLPNLHSFQHSTKAVHTSLRAMASPNGNC